MMKTASMNGQMELPTMPVPPSASSSPAIAQCSPASIFGAVMQASILGFQSADALGY